MFGRGKRPDRSGRSELASALHDCKRALGGIVVFSGLMNLLTLTGPLFMLQIYDRVVPSQSIATLIGLAAITALLYAALGFFDNLRARILIRVAAYVDEVVHPKVFRAIVTLPLRNALPGDGLQPLRDLDQIRSFIGGGGPAAFADLPFLPFQIIICFLIDPLIGWAVICGAVVIFFLTLLTDVTVRKATEDASVKGGERMAMIEASRRNAEVLRALGMGSRLAKRWGEVNRSYEASHQTVLERSGTYSGISKVFRMMFQSFLLGLGAYLVIVNHASFGVIIAASILGARALQPIEMLVANWKGFVASRQAWGRLNRLLAQFPDSEDPMPLPAPKGTLKVENLAVVPPASSRPSVVDVSFQLKAGSALGGGTLINWTNCLKPKPWVRQEWADEYGLEDVNTPDFDRHIDSVWNRLMVNDDCSELNQTQKTWIDAAEKLGWSWHKTDRNWDREKHDPAMAGYMGWGDQSGAKQSTLKTYLQDAVENGAEVIVGCQAEKVLVEDGRAAGVEANFAGARVTIRAPRVVVAGGSLESPALLLRSGIGGPAAGKHLRLHPCTLIFASYSEDQKAWWGAPHAAVVNEFENGSKMTATAS